MSTPYARFDDLRPQRRRSFELSNSEQILVARDSTEVVDVLAAAEKAVESGRWVAGFVAYEAARGLDPALEVACTRGTRFDSVPLVWFAVFSDRSPTDQSSGGEYQLGAWEATVGEDEHHRSIEQIQDLIKYGHTYQVNYTFGSTASFTGSVHSLYCDLISAQTCGYGALLETGGWTIASASPELFFEWSNGRIVCRPMKGTAPRGLTTRSDEHQRLNLLASTKDQAENVMIVDMVRNDLGRIAAVGSVETPALFSAEKYDTVWQLTSTVTARTRPNTSLVDVFRALFPSASITGAPKVSTMRIIRDLETGPRGVYCGAVGFGGPGVDGNPEWAFNVAIRTVVVDEDNGLAHYGTGGGITIDSTAAGEYREALLKTEVLERRTADFRLLETMAWRPDSNLWLLDRHLDRVMESAWYFDIPVDRAALEVAIKEVSDPLPEPALLRLLVDRTGEFVCEAGAMPPAIEAPSLAVDDRPIDRSDPLLYHKTTSRRVYDQARERHPGADDVILWNEAGEITETSIGNLVVQIDGTWWTPPVSSGCLPGTYRAELLELGEIEERPITVEELRGATSIARINSVRGWELAHLMPPLPR
jgi:para-aminobenzoate synthetase/4-amino-4-deoxychorismate lyase